MLRFEDYDEGECGSCQSPRGRIPVERILEKFDSFIGDKQYDRAFSHLKYWLEEAKLSKDEAGEIVMLGELMGFCRKQGMKEEAYAYASDAIHKVEKNGFLETVTGATAILNAGTVYMNFEEYDKSVSCYEKAIVVYEKELSDADSRLGGLYNNFATALLGQKRYDDALNYYEKALDVMSKDPDGRLECAITYLNIADLYEKRNGFEESVNETDKLLDMAFDILKDEKIERNSYYYFVLDKCIPAYDHFGQFLKSAELKGILKQ